VNPVDQKLTIGVKMANDANPLKRGINRIGIFLGAISSSLLFIFMIVITSCCRGQELLISLPITFGLSVIGLVVPVYTAKAIAWIAEGFQSKEGKDEVL